MLAGLGWANHRAAGLVLGTEKIQHLSVQSVQFVHYLHSTVHCTAKYLRGMVTRFV